MKHSAHAPDTHIRSLQDRALVAWARSLGTSLRWRKGRCNYAQVAGRKVDSGAASYFCAKYAMALLIFTRPHGDGARTMAQGRWRKVDGAMELAQGYSVHCTLKRTHTSPQKFIAAHTFDAAQLPNQKIADHWARAQLGHWARSRQNHIPTCKNNKKHEKKSGEFPSASACDLGTGKYLGITVSAGAVVAVAAVHLVLLECWRRASYP